MWYLSNSQDVISNSHGCSGAYCGFQHSPSVTEILARFPVEPWELECCSFLDSNYSSCTIGLGCDWTGKHQARHWQKLFTVSPEYLSFLPVFLWLPNSAFLCRMHGCAFFTVEHLWEGFKVLQRPHHPVFQRAVNICLYWLAGIFWSVGTTPNLGKVEEEKLFVGQIQSRQLRFLPFPFQPF